MDYLLLLHPTKRKKSEAYNRYPNKHSSKRHPKYKNKNFETNKFYKPSKWKRNPQENSTPKTKNEKEIATSVANSVIMQINVESRK